MGLVSRHADFGSPPRSHDHGSTSSRFPQGNCLAVEAWASRTGVCANGNDQPAKEENDRQRYARIQRGNLKRSRGGMGGRVKSRRQAIAIASIRAAHQSLGVKSQKRKSARKSRRKESHGRTSRQRTEGKSRVGARDRRESSRRTGRKNATRVTTRGRKVAAHRRKSTHKSAQIRKSRRKSQCS